jgi:hypothetical protein
LEVVRSNQGVVTPKEATEHHEGRQGTCLNDLGCTEEIEHEIRLTDETPFRQPHRRVPQGQLEEFRMAVQDLLQSGVIRESNSPFASPVVLVRKKDGGLRICVDFRTLNARTIRDSYPLPRITETLEALKGARYFCTIDLAEWLPTGENKGRRPRKKLR